MSAKLFAFLFFLLLAMLPSAAQAAPTSSVNGVNGGYSYASSLINQMVEQNFADPNAAFGPAFAQLLNNTNGTGRSNETYQGISQFWHDDLLGIFFAGINQTISHWLNHFFSGYLPDIISSLSSVVKSFFLNPNLAQITANANNPGDFSSLLKQLVNIIYGIALDLLFVLFIVSIWQYWTKASWQGNISAMSAVGRLICTIGIILAWPTVYSFEIELSNEMISAIFANGADQLRLFDMAMANMFNIGMYSGLLGTLMKSQMIAVGVAHLSGFLSAIALLALCILAIVLIYELVYLIALKAMQTALLTAQYVFGPVFLIFFATASTEKMATGYIRTFAETSVWSFIWIGLLKILVILMYANFNPWGKIITAIGILQLMMRVPQFLGRFKVSSASAFVNPAFLTNGLHKRALTYAGQIENYKNQFVSAFTGMFRGAGAADQATSGAGTAGNNMSADFSFGNAGGNVLQLPNSDRHKSGHSGYMDSRSEKNTTADTSNLPSPVIDMPSTPTSPVGKNIDTGRAIKTHTSFSVPGRRSVPRKKDIFTRHNKTSGNDGVGDIINLPAGKQAPYGVPTAAAALLSNSALPGFNPSGSDTPNFSSFSLSSFRHFGKARLPGITLSKFDQPADRLNLAADKTNLSASRLLAVRLAAAQLKYGSGSALVARQQFALPSFERNNHRPHYDLGNGNKPGIDKMDRDLKINRGHILAEDHANSYGKSLFNDHTRSLPKAKTRQPNDKQTTTGTPLLNEYVANSYYSSPIYPGWQRPYYLNSRNSLPLHSERRSSFYAGINYPASPCFRSYYN